MIKFREGQEPDPSIIHLLLEVDQNKISSKRKNLFMIDIQQGENIQTRLLDHLEDLIMLPKN